MHLPPGDRGALPGARPADRGRHALRPGVPPQGGPGVPAGGAVVAARAAQLEVQLMCICQSSNRRGLLPRA